MNLFRKATNSLKHKGKPGKRRSSSRTHLELQGLEQRQLLSGQPLTAVPVLHSNPGAPVTIYLDFNGHHDPDWWVGSKDDDGNPTNDEVATIIDSNGNLGTYTQDDNDSLQPVFDMDGDATTFSDAELDMIRDIWRRVADDWSLFNVNVTTAMPGTGDLADGKGLLAAIRYGNHGGVANGGVIDGRIAWTDAGISNSVYASGTDASMAAATVSQEIAHDFGLFHQFSAGSAASRPIMNGTAGSGRNLWWNGQADSGGMQDDIAVLLRPATGLTSSVDDHGDGLAQATSLGTSSDPQSKVGIIGQASEVDWFGFQVSGGTYTLYVDAVENLDARLELRDAGGNLIDQIDPAGSLSAAMNRSLAAGQYYLVVASSDGSYGNAGMYTVGVARAGLRVTSSEPAPGKVRLTFNNPVDPGSFTTSDVRILDRAGNLVPGVSIAPVSGAGNLIWEITFSPPAQGGYRLEVGPVIADRWGNAMDQDGDGSMMESVDDKFILEDFQGPRVLDVVLLNPPPFSLPFGSGFRTFSVPPVLLVTFSEAMDPASLTNGTIKFNAGNLGSPTLVSSGPTGWTYAFSVVVTTPGSYPVTVEATATDLFGNRLDQDRDGQGGETVADRYTKTVRVDNVAQKPARLSLDKLEAWFNGGRNPFERLPQKLDRAISRRGPTELRLRVEEHLRTVYRDAVRGLVEEVPQGSFPEPGAQSWRGPAEIPAGELDRFFTDYDQDDAGDRRRR